MELFFEFCQHFVRIVASPEFGGGDVLTSSNGRGADVRVVIELVYSFWIVVVVVQ